MLIYDDTPIFDCNPLVGSGTGPSAPNTDPLYCRGCAPCAMPRRLARLLPLLGTLRSPGCPPFVRTSSCADEAEPMRVFPKQRRSPRHRTMTCSDKTRYESTTCPQNTLKTRKHPQNVSGREAFAHFMEIMGSAVVLPLRGESCTELRGEPGAALSCGEGTERVLPSLNPFSSRIRMR
jgi:hypothetical protein